MTVNCPECQSVIYSRKTKVCEQCGAVLPWVLMEIEARKLEEDRRWARELAEKVTSTAFGVSGSRSDEKLHGAGSDVDASSLSPEELLEQFSYAEAFRTRPRPYFWIYVAGYGFYWAAFGFAYSIVKGWPLLPWNVFKSLPLILRDAPLLLALNCIVGMALYAAWRRASPICPRCRQNIRACAAEHCHVCGGPLTQRQCARCDVDHTWTGWLRGDRGGRFKWIKYCPGCGVQLDTKISRWQR